MSEENTPQVTPLFRIEAIDARKETWLGRPLVLNPVSLCFVMWFGVTATIAIISFLALLGDTQSLVAEELGIERDHVMAEISRSSKLEDIGPGSSETRATAWIVNSTNLPETGLTE